VNNASEKNFQNASILSLITLIFASASIFLRCSVSKTFFGAFESPQSVHTHDHASPLVLPFGALATAAHPLAKRTDAQTVRLYAPYPTPQTV